MVKYTPAISRDTKFDPWSWKIPHATGQLSPQATTTEPTHSRAHALLQEKPLQMRGPRTTAGEWPLLSATRESPHVATKTQHSQK